MNWSTPHILAAIALLVALFGGGLLWFPNADARASGAGFTLAVLLICVAMLVT